VDNDVRVDLGLGLGLDKRGVAMVALEYSQIVTEAWVVVK
jgi:hypothetical protein